MYLYCHIKLAFFLIVFVFGSSETTHLVDVLVAKAATRDLGEGLSVSPA